MFLFFLQVRAASVGVAVALAQCPSSLQMFEPLVDVYTEVAQMTVDTTECSLVRQQAAILLSNIMLSVAHHAEEDSPRERKVSLQAVRRQLFIMWSWDSGIL